MTPGARPSPLQLLEHALETLALLGKQRTLGIVSRREVRVDRRDGQVLARQQRRHRAIELIVTEPEPVHARVDLQMTREAHAAARGGLFQRDDGLRCRYGGRQLVLEHAVDVANAERAEDEDGQAHAGAAQQDAFFDIRGREERRTSRFERQRDARGAVAVRVGLHHADDAGAVSG